MTADGRSERARIVASLATLAVALVPARSPAQTFVVTDTSVRQGRFEAIALTRDSIVSSYPRAAREVRFRFSLGGAENEFPSGTEHTIYLRPRGGRLATRLYRFGVEDAPTPPTAEQSASSEDGTARVTFRLDLRHVLAALRATGHYDPPLGARLVGVPSHVYVIGDPAPLSWDYASLHPGSPAELHDADGDGIYEGTVAIATEYTRPARADGRAVWGASRTMAGAPALRSTQRLQDASYRLSLEELAQLVRADGALSAGAKWPGVWTRDVSLATVLSLPIAAPDAVRHSLLAKVDRAGRIIQDTGTGGSWPVSSDRMVWALAAWELYAWTGDSAWLRQSYDIIRRSADADRHALRDASTGLVRGESSFLDWREQSYPRWMQPADIAQSENLGTNAVHVGAYRVLARMSRALGEPDARWDAVADSVRDGMSKTLWQPGTGWYAQYRYGRTSMTTSPRAEGLGEALAVLTGAASTAQRDVLLRNAPSMASGTPTFFPSIPGERLYHNGTVWPFVSAFWSWAAAEGGNADAVQRGLDIATRDVALFLTNKENTVASTGHYEGTALNSDRQLWSVAGTLSSTYRLLFGMRAEEQGLRFAPMVPPSYGGERTLTGLRYRRATLSITVHGFGDAVTSATMDGVPMAKPVVATSAAGPHSVVLTMNGRWKPTPAALVVARYAPAAPSAHIAGAVLAWARVPGALRYEVHRAGERLAITRGTTFRITSRDGVDEYQVLAVNGAGDQSFLSEPVRVVPAGAERLASPRDVPLERTEAGFTGAGYVRLTRDSNTTVRIPVHVERAGSYAIDARYANGNGPVNTEDKVAVRTLLVDADTAGVIVMPQRGAGRWREWGWSTVTIRHLTAGEHVLTLSFTPLDENMNGRENTALLDVVRLSRLAADH